MTAKQGKTQVIMYRKENMTVTMFAEERILKLPWI